MAEAAAVSKVSKKKKKKSRSGSSGSEVDRSGVDFDSTKLHRAKNARKVIKYLGTKGVDCTALCDGDTPLHAYVRRQDKQKLNCLMAFLIHAKCDVNVLNSSGDTALHLACKKSDLVSARVLITFDADINGFNRSQETPLDLAYINWQLADLLSEIGAKEKKKILENSDQTEEEENESLEGSFEPMLGPSVMSGVGVSQPEIKADAPNGETGKEEEGIDVKKTIDTKKEETLYFDAVGGDKLMSSIPEDDEMYMTPDHSVEMAITQHLIHKSGMSRSTQDYVISEAGILKENPFFPKIIEDTVHSFENLPDHDATKVRPARQKSPKRSPQRSPHRSPQRSPHRSPQRSPHRSPQGSPHRSPQGSPHRSPQGSPHRSPQGNPPRKSSPPPSSPAIETPQSSQSPLPPFTPSPRSQSPTEKQAAVDAGQLEVWKKNYTRMYPAREESVDGGGNDKLSSSDDEIQKADPSGEQNVVRAEQEGTKTESKEVLMKSQGFVNYTEGEFFNRLDACTTEAMERALENSLGDEGYAAWLQYREIEKLKREREALKSEEVDSKEEEHKGRNPALPSSKEAPHSILKVPAAAKKKHPKQVHIDLPSRRSTDDDRPPKKPPRQRWRQQNPESGVMRSISRLNPNMSVVESVLGKSLVPLRRKLTEGKKGQRILCLDGGGVKGVVQIEILRTIEQLTGKRIVDLFDWIVGTSTGGIVALGTVYGKLTLKDLRRIYFEMKDSVFKPPNKMFPTACDTEALEALIKKSLGTKAKMNDEHHPKVLVTAVDKSTTDMPLRFFNNCFDDEYSKEEVWRVARYTSAAPVLFKELDNYIDGGVVANNPCNFALTHIIQHLRGLKKQKKSKKESTDIACIVSVGCGIFPGEPIGNTDIVDALRPTKLTQLPSKIKDAITMLTTAMTKSEDQANMCHVYCEQLDIPFFRLSPHVGEMVGTAETDGLKLCDTIISTKKMLFEKQEHLRELVESLGCSFVPQRRITT